MKGECINNDAFYFGWILAHFGKLYYTSEMGDVYVVRAGPSLELLAVNSMDEVVMATPAISEGTIYFRTRSHVVAVGSDEGN